QTCALPISGFGKQFHCEIVAMRPRTTLRHDQRLICEIGDGHAFLRCERMMIGNRDNGGLMKKKHKLQPFVRAFRGAHESYVKPAWQTVWEQPYRLIFDQLNRDIRPLLPEFVKQHRQQSSGSTVDRAYTDSGSLISAPCPVFGSENIGLDEQGPGFLLKSGPEVLPEKPDKGSKRRWQHFETLRCPAKMQFFRRRHEASQLMKVHRLSPGPSLYHFFV